MEMEFKRVGVWEGILDPAHISSEVGGSEQYAILLDKPGGISVVQGSANGVAVGFHSREDDMPFVHHDLKKLFGHRIRVIVEKATEGHANEE